MSFGQRFIDNLRKGHLTGEIPTELADAMSDDLIWKSLAKSSLGNQSRGKQEWLDFIKNDKEDYSSEVVYENDEIVVWKGAGVMNGQPQVFLFCMKLPVQTLRSRLTILSVWCAPNSDLLLAVCLMNSDSG